MKTLLRSFLILTAVLSCLHAAPGPIRVLYLGKENTASSRHCPVFMREFGRDAIWFDYISSPRVVTPEWIAKFDAVLLDAPEHFFPALSGVDSKRVVNIAFDQDEKMWEQTNFIETVKAQLLAAVGEKKRAEWKEFLAQRETEAREPNANIANYEQRPQPVTFQHPFSVKSSKDRTQVPIDMRLELFAAEPDIAKPISFAWDERGRLWVAETRDYPHGVVESGEGHDDIKICEDTDGDGKADKFTIFADKLNIPTSFVFVNGGIIVSQPPRFLFLADTNADDKADVRKEIMTGWWVGDTHAQANNLHWGYDNWLYGCVGYSGFKGEIGGEKKQFSMGTYRFKADGSALEFLYQFSNNSWAHSANEFGDQFGGTANGAPIFYGGIPATIAPKSIRVMSAKKINIEEKAHAITPNFRQVDVFGGYTAAAGSAFIYSSNMPARLQGKAMVCEPTMKLIALMDVQPSGAGYVAKDGFNLVASSDEWMSPVCAEVGPDGAVWFADWQNFIIQHNPTPTAIRGGYDAVTGVGGAHENPLRDHVRGRIYRVVWEGAKRPSITSLKNAGSSELVNALQNDNPFWRLTAQRLLVEQKKTDPVAALKKIVTSTNSGIAAVHALWSLHGLGQLDDATHQTALLSQNSGLRRNATRALGTNESAKALFFSAGVVTDPDPITRLAAFVKLADFPTSKEIQTVVANLSRNSALRKDEWLDEALRILGKRHRSEAYVEGPNLLPNADLELSGPDGLPQGWRRQDCGGGPGNDAAEWKIVTGEGEFHSGKSAVRCLAREEAETSVYVELSLKTNTLYRLGGWLKSTSLKGRLSFTDQATKTETQRMTREGDWNYVEVDFNSGSQTNTTITMQHVARSESYFDDVKLCELISAEQVSNAQILGVAKRGEDIFYNHTARCVLCHMVKGNGSTVGPALDGIASRATADYIRESLLEPSKVLAKGYESLGLSPMPPMGEIFSAQELADIQAFVLTLK